MLYRYTCHIKDAISWRQLVKYFLKFTENEAMARKCSRMPCTNLTIQILSNFYTMKAAKISKIKVSILGVNWCIIIR